MPNNSEVLMKQFMLHALLVLSYVSCGHNGALLNDLINDGEGGPDYTATTNPVFVEYLVELGLESTTPVIFSDLSKSKATTAAVCVKWNSGHKEIRVRKNYWDTIDRKHRLSLLAHEIGHCDYDLDHNDEILEDGCPASIMASMNFGGSCFKKHYNYYMEEFNG